MKALRGIMRKYTQHRGLYRFGQGLLSAGLAAQVWMAMPAIDAVAQEPIATDSPATVRLVQFTDDSGTSVLNRNTPKSDNPVTSAFKKAGNSIQDFFTSDPEKPQVDGDPVSLSSMPDEVGANVYMSAARMMENAGNVEGAERQYKACLEKHPNHRLALLSYGRLLHRSQRLGDSLKIYQLAIEHHPEDATLNNDLGLCLARMGQHDEAMAHFHKATVLAPEDPRYRNNLAMVLVDAGRFEEALSQLMFAHGEAKGHYNLGYLLYRKGDTGGAAQAFEIALQVDPQLKPAEEMLRRINAEEGQPARTAQTQRVPPAPTAMFISDEPKDSVGPGQSSGKVPPAPDLDAPRLLPPVR